MARMIKLTNGTTGNDIYINVDLIRTVSSGPDDRASIRLTRNTRSWFANSRARSYKESVSGSAIDFSASTVRILQREPRREWFCCGISEQVCVHDFRQIDLLYRNKTVKGRG